MRLTVEEHPEATQRYAHVEPARGWSARTCAARLLGTARTCSRERGHRGPHVAHAWFQRVVAVWDADSSARAPDGASRRAQSPRPPKELRKRAPLGLPIRTEGILEALRARIARTVASAEEIAFVILFVAFVGFAIYWFRLILG